MEAYLRDCLGIRDIHDLDIWGMSTTNHACVLHPDTAFAHLH